VEAVIEATRAGKGVVFYRVKWKGWTTTNQHTLDDPSLTDAQRTRLKELAPLFDAEERRLRAGHSHPHPLPFSAAHRALRSLPSVLSYLREKEEGEGGGRRE
jgi:hypothetical protein